MISHRKIAVTTFLIFVTGAMVSCKARGRAAGKNFAAGAGESTETDQDFQCEAPTDENPGVQPDPGNPEPARLADPGYPYQRGGCSVDDARQESEWAIVEDCYRAAQLPAGAGRGYVGNLLWQPKCTNVHATVTKQVVRCATEKFKNAGWQYATLSFLPCSIFQSGLVSDHVYMGICKASETRKTEAALCVWTDPWDGLGEFYLPGTGRNRPSHTVNFSM
jgi:hypothetical protein